MTLDVVLKQQQSGGTPPRSLDELKALATEMARHYYKGFGDKIDGILNCATAYLRLPDDKEKRRSLAYSTLKEIEEFYATIPFGQLERKAEFMPLFEVRDLLPQLRITVDNFFEKIDNEWLDKLNQIAIKIVQTGRPYFDMLRDLTRMIRTFPEGKDFAVEITDRNGYVYRW